MIWNQAHAILTISAVEFLSETRAIGTEMRYTQPPFEGPRREARTEDRGWPKKPS